jgi:hypothetical protein
MANFLRRLAGAKRPPARQSVRASFVREGALGAAGALDDELLAGPARRTLLDEGSNAFAEVGTAVGRGDEVVAVGNGACVLQAPDRFLGHPERDRRVRCELRGELAHAGLDAVGGNDLVHEAGAERLVRRQQPAVKISSFRREGPSRSK